MNKNAKAWIKALRSGDYKQGTEQLHTGSDNLAHSFCCLGVACDLYQKENKLLMVGYDDQRRAYTYNGCLSMLPDSVKEWLGLNHNNGTYIEPEKGIRTLIEDNDGGSSFEMIANIIESEPKGLFL